MTDHAPHAPSLRLARQPMAAPSSHHAAFGPCKVVVLAGGFGTRLAERTDAMPKPMVEIGGWPVLWHILKIYSHHGFNDFLIAGGYKCEVIKRFFLEYHHRESDVVIDFINDEIHRMSDDRHTDPPQPVEPWRVGVIDTGDDTMTGGRIRRLAQHLPRDATFLMTYGDGLSNVNINDVLTFHRQHGRLATMTVVRQPSQFGRPELDGDRVAAFVEKPRNHNEWINAGFFALQPTVLSYISGDDVSFENDVLPRLAADNQLCAFQHHGFFHAMDTLRDVRNLNAMWQAGNVPWKIWAQSLPHTQINTKRDATNHTAESPCHLTTIANASL